MKRLLIALTTSSLALTACSPTMKSERKHSTYKPSKAGDKDDATDHPGEETPSIDPVETPVADPVVPAKPTLPPWDNGVTGPMRAALNAALSGEGIDAVHEVYTYKWKIDHAAIVRNGNTITVEGSFSRSNFFGGDKVAFDFEFVDGKLERNDIFIKNNKNPLVILGPIASIVGAYFGIPIPADAVGTVVDQIDQIAVGNWQEAAQKLAFRIGMAAFQLAMAQQGAA